MDSGQSVFTDNNAGYIRPVHWLLGLSMVLNLVLACGLVYQIMK